MSGPDDGYRVQLVVELLIAPDLAAEDVREELAALLTGRDGWAGEVVGTVKAPFWGALPCD
jgi:hypothetical protein